MTRNEAYKVAKKAWKFWFKRGTREYQTATENALCELRVLGYTTKDIDMVSLWLKAMRSGRRWPREEDMRRIEKSKD